MFFFIMYTTKKKERLNRETNKQKNEGCMTPMFFLHKLNQVKLIDVHVCYINIKKNKRVFQSL